jgi:hypothetical protein
MFLGLPLQTWLGLSVVGSAISTLGALLGILLKDYFFSRSFERWKQRQTLELLYQKYRDPLLLSARELASRTADIVQHYPTVYLTAEVLASRPEKQIANSIDDPYFRRYKLLSTVYRFCAFLGWIELYRQDLTYLHSGSNRHSWQLARAVELIREDLADGQLNHAIDWPQWRDTLVFREELRAVGESMIETRGAIRTVMGYGRFADMLDASEHSPTKGAARVLLNFLLDLEVGRQDFRKARLQRIAVHLVDLMRLLGETDIEHALIEASKAWRPVTL